MAVTKPDNLSLRALRKTVEDDLLLTDDEGQDKLVKPLQDRWIKGGREALNEFLKIAASDPKLVISPRVLAKLETLSGFGVETSSVTQIQTRQAKAIEVFNTL